MKYKIIDSTRDEHNEYPYMVEDKLGVPLEVFKTKEEAESYLANLNEASS